MANLQKNCKTHLKRVKPVKAVGEGSSMDSPKRMCLPPTDFIDDTTQNTNSVRNIQIIDHDLLAKLLQSHSGAELTVNSVISPTDGCEETDDFENNDSIIEDNLEAIDGNAGIAEEQNLEEQEQVSHDSAVCCVKCRVERERFENIVVSKLNSVLELVRGITNRAVDEKNVHRGNYELLPPMPFEEVDALQRFDRDLEDEMFRDQFRNKIKDMGGKTVQKAVKFAMEIVMSDSLTKRVVWSQGGEGVPKISKLRFPSIINDVIRNNFDGTTKKQIESRIADWLRRGGDRIRAAAAAAEKEKH